MNSIFDVFCRDESAVIGTITLGKGKATARRMRDGFSAASGRDPIIKLRDGVHAQCPRCRGLLDLRAEIEGGGVFEHALMPGDFSLGVK